MTPASPVTRSARGREVVAAGRRLLEEEGPEALTMRRLAERVGIRAPSLYKHLPDKAALEAAIIATGFEEAAAAFEAAVEDAGGGGGEGAHGGAGGTASDGAGPGPGRRCRPWRPRTGGSRWPIRISTG